MGGRYESTPPTFTTGDRVESRFDSRGNLQVTLMNKDGIAGPGLTTSLADASANNPSRITVGNFPHIFNGSTWDRDTAPNASSRIPTSAASVNATSAKASAGRIFTIIAYNTTASTIYLKVYNMASAPTVGTDTPVLTLPIPAGGGLAMDWPKGLYCSTGIAYALTTSVADAGSAAVGAGDIVGLNVVYA